MSRTINRGTICPAEVLNIQICCIFIFFYFFFVKITNYFVITTFFRDFRHLKVQKTCWCTVIIKSWVSELFWTVFNKTLKSAPPAASLGWDAENASDPYKIFKNADFSWFINKKMIETACTCENYFLHILGKQ